MPENSKLPENTPDKQSHMKRDLTIAGVIGGTVASVVGGAVVIDSLNTPKPQPENPQQKAPIAEQSQVPATLGVSVEASTPAGAKIIVSNFPSPMETQQQGALAAPSTSIAEKTPVPSGNIGTGATGTPVPEGEIGSGAAGTPESAPTDKQMLQALINGEHAEVSTETLLNNINEVYKNPAAEELWPEKYALNDVSVTGENQQAALETLVDYLNKIYIKIPSPQSYEALKSAIDRAVNVLGPSEKDRLINLFQITS
jgi:hypothetical protein